MYTKLRDVIDLFGGYSFIVMFSTKWWKSLKDMLIKRVILIIIAFKNVTSS